jgi:hypothetical protein
VYPCTLTFQPSAQDPVYLAVNVAARLFLAPGTTAAGGQAIGAAIRARLASFFRITNPDGTPNLSIDFGFYLSLRGGSSEIAWSDVFDLLVKTPGVRKIEPYDLALNGLPSDVKIAPREFPTLGNVRLVDAGSGGFL